MALQARHLNSSFNPEFWSAGARHLLWSKETANSQRNPVIKLKSKQTSFPHQIPASHPKATDPESNSKHLTTKTTATATKKKCSCSTTHCFPTLQIPSLMQPSKPRCCQQSPTRHQKHGRVKRPTKSPRTPLSPYCRWRERWRNDKSNGWATGWR